MRGRATQPASFLPCLFPRVVGTAWRGRESDRRVPSSAGAGLACWPADAEGLQEAGGFLKFKKGRAEEKKEVHISVMTFSVRHACHWNCPDEMLDTHQHSVYCGVF